jgi:methionine sulfoxide reductase catalytic subunit
MKRFTRREFARILASGAALSLFGGCAPQNPLSSSSSATLGGPATSGPGTPRRTLKNDNPESFYVRYYKPFEAVDPASWALSVDGIVKTPRQFTLADVQALPRVSQVSRMKCVECWSAPAKWEGFRYEALSSMVEPDPEAKWVHFHCADGYYESLSVEELRMDRVLFVHRMNDQPIPDVYGAPLRMIVPFKYGYKGPKAITQLTFAKEQLQGLWPAVGGYSVNGNIQEGFDHPLDLKDTRPIDGDEIRYPDGPESKG